jgi:HSP20 family molecular chaperone IbpA
MSCDCTNTACAVDTGAATTTATPAAETRAPVRRPAFNVRENAEAFDVEVFVPGANRAGVDLSLEDDVLAITAKRAAPAPDSWRLLRREIAGGDYRLDLTLNVPVNADAIQATVEDGVLRLTLPKAEEIKARRIAVN